MKNYTNYFLFFLILFSYQCTSPSSSNYENDNGVQIKFSNIESQSTSILKDINFVKLETDNDILLRDITQIEVFQDDIFILCSSGLYVFDLSGNYVRSIRHTGNGPGEFLSPYSFWIDKKEHVFILDRQLNRLQKYDAKSLNFVESVTMPYDSPIGFAKIPEKDIFIYYYPLRASKGIEDNQIIIADKKGEIISELYPGNASGKILHGNNTNFYLMPNKLMFYPYFSNRIYEIDMNAATAHNKYALHFEDNDFPDETIFTKYDNSGDIMKEILFGSHKWIRLNYIYETTDNLLIKYYH